MNVWKLTAAKTLACVAENPVAREGKRKIRVTKVFVNKDDASIFSGALRVNYPRVMGRFAVGVVADDNEGLYRKGTRVLLHTILPEQIDETDCPKAETPVIMGQTADGFLRDFVFVDENDITPLPDAVNDEKALLIQYVALAKAAIDKLSPQKGDHIAVIGGDMLGLFVCQLLIYQQVSPILVDSRKSSLDFARNCGVYYTSLADETLLSNLGDVTGGRFADGVIYAAADENGAAPFPICARGKTVVFCGQNGNEIQLPLNDILEKQLSVHGISEGTDYIETAINLIANKAVNLSVYRANTIGADALAALFLDFMQNPVRPVDELNIVNLL